jgi:hypothetical protein
MNKLLRVILNLSLGKFFVIQALLNYCELVSTYTEKTYPRNSIVGLTLLQSTALEVKELIIDFNRDMILPKKKAPKKWECDSMGTH